MNKKIIIIAFLFMLITSTVGTGFVSLAEANFKPAPHPAITDRPRISLLQPEINGIIRENETVTVVFNVTMPQSWNWTATWDGRVVNMFVGTIKNVTCTLDKTQIVSNTTKFGGEVFNTNKNTTIQYAKCVGNLSAGKHTLTISVSAHTYYLAKYPIYSNYDVSTSVMWTFIVGGYPPDITNLSPEKSTYNTSDIPLVFRVNQTTSWAGYSIDNQANVTANGNVTLTDLTEGNHSIVIYANDTFGNMGKSGAAFFNIILPTPTPLPTPSPSPTQQQTQEPSPTPTASFYSDWIQYVIIALVAVVGIGASAVYLKRRKRAP